MNEAPPRTTPRRTALSINASADYAGVRRIETPLGTRFEISVRTVTGNRKVVALLLDEGTSARAAVALNDAIRALRRASIAIADGTAS